MSELFPSFYYPDVSHCDFYDRIKSLKLVIYVKIQLISTPPSILLYVLSQKRCPSAFYMVTSLLKSYIFTQSYCNSIFYILSCFIVSTLTLMILHLFNLILLL